MQHSQAATGRTVASTPRGHGGPRLRFLHRVYAPGVWGPVSTALITALLAYAALTPLAPFARDTYANEARRHVILGAVLVLYVALLAAGRRLPPRTALDLPLLGILIAIAAGVAGSINPRVSAETALTVLPVAPLFYLLADRRLTSATALHRGILLTGLALAAFALASVWNQWQDWLALVRAVDGGVSRGMLLPPSVPRVEGVGSHPNVLGAMLATVAPLYLLAFARGGRGGPAPSTSIEGSSPMGQTLVARTAPATGPASVEGIPPMGSGRVVPTAAKPVDDEPGLAGRMAGVERNPPIPGVVHPVLAAGGLVLVLVALFFTLSRGAWAGAAAGLAVTAAGMAGATGLRPRHWKRWVGAAAIVAVLGAAGTLVLGHARPDWLFRDSLNPRADMRRAGIEIFRDNPLTGAGPGMYVSLYPQHNGAHPFAAVHSHNIVVQVAADYGLLGLAAGAVMLAVLALVLARRYLGGTPGTRRVAAAVAGALTAFLVHGLVDSPHLFPEALLLLGAAVALVTGVGDGFTTEARWHRGERRANKTASIRTQLHFPSGPAPRLRASVVNLRALPPLMIVALGLALLPAWWYVDRAAAEHEHSTRASAKERRDEAVAAAQRAVARDPRFSGYRLQLGAAYAARYHAAGDPADRDAAIHAYEEGLARPPLIGAALVDLASLRLDAGDVPGTWAAIEQLRAAAGRDGLLQLAYAVLVQWSGSPQEAIETYAGLLALNPTLAVTPFWRDDDFRRTNYDAIVDRALERAEEITGPGNAEGLRTAIRLLTGRDPPREQQVRAALAAAPGDVTLQVALGRLLTAGGRLADAEPLLKDAVGRKGDSMDAHRALGDWYAASGEIRQARREWLRAAYLGDVAAGDALGRSFEPGRPPAAVVRRQRQLVEGAFITRFYLPFQTYRFTFQRREPAPIIGPGDWLDALPDDFPQWGADLRRWEGTE